MALVTSAAASLKNTWGFSPQSIPGLQLWLDGADTTSITGTSTVTAWRDKSGNGNNATATGSPALTQNAINGVQAISTAVGTYFLGPVSITGSTLTCFAVATTNVTMPNVRNPRRSQRLVSLANGANRDYAANGVIPLFNQDNTNTISIYKYTDGAIIPSNPIQTNIPFLAVTHFDGTTASLWFNGSPGTVPTNPYNTSFIITKYGIGEQANPDNGENWSGFFGEILLFSTALTTPQRQQVEGYLAAKWGLKANLPATHPYSATASVPFNRPFYPTDIGGCQLWLDAADFSSMTVNQANSNITVWKDKSGNGRDAVPSVGGVSASTTMNPPVYTTTPYVGASFDSAKQMAAPIPSGTFSTAFSGFVVFNFTGTPDANAYSILNRSGNGTNAPFSIAQINGTVFRAIGGSPGGTFSSAAGTPLTSTTQSIYYVNIASSANTTWNESVNGTLTAYSTAANSYGSGGAQYGDAMNYVNIGGRYDVAVRYNGIISEVICYNFTLTTPQRQQVEQYLAWKWGLPVANLPTGHPGKLLPAFGTPFTPKSLTGLRLWLDGADTTSMVRSETTVTRWNDKSGNGGDATATGSPTSTGSGVVYPNTGIYFTLNTAYASTHTIYIVCTTTIASQVYLFGRNYASSAPAFITNYTGTSLEYYDDPRGRYTLAATPTSTFIASYIRTFGTSLALRYNGSQIGGLQASPTTSENTSVNWGYLGAATTTAGYYSGTIYEFMIFNAALTTDQAQQVEGYLAWKWGLQSSLPSTHAYAKFSP